jgi:hypothetical protein
LLFEWSKWFVGISTGAIGLIFTLEHREQSPVHSKWARVAAVLFAVSIGGAAMLMGALPSIIQRITSEWTNIYELGVGDSEKYWNFVRVVDLASIQGWSFFLAALALVLGILAKIRLWQKMGAWIADRGSGSSKAPS